MATEAISNSEAHCCSAELTCKHCGAPSESGDFCCAGCAAANAAMETMQGADHINTSFASLATKAEDGTHGLELAVEGIHCAACIRLIENALTAHKDVVQARVNMTTERVRFSWTGSVERGDALAADVVSLGYKLRAPHENNDASSKSDNEKSLLKSIAVAGFAAGNCPSDCGPVLLKQWGLPRESCCTGCRRSLRCRQSSMRDGLFSDQPLLFCVRVKQIWMFPYQSLLFWRLS